MLPTDPKERKDTPIFSGVLMYFPLALAAVSRVSKKGNDKHNGEGTPLQWTRDISPDHLDSATRHIIDAGPDGTGEGEDGTHLANAIWRLCAQLELNEEKRLSAYKPKGRRDPFGTGHKLAECPVCGQADTDCKGCCEHCEHK